MAIDSKQYYFSLMILLGILPLNNPTNILCKRPEQLKILIQPTASIANSNITTSSLSEDSLSLPNGQRWLRHVEHELLPFWLMPAALGTPIGNFPSIRCDDGSLLDQRHPCPEVKDHKELMLDRHYVVALSRQIYTYGVAFHLTGNPKYLKYSKAGVDFLRQNALDRQHGGAYSYKDNTDQSWGPSLEYRTAQEQAYALLGLSFYYYLTRDREVLTDILAVKEFIFNTYYNADLGLLQWQLKDGNNGQALDKQLTAQLDQLNSYMVLITPILPEPYQTEWKQDMVKLAKIILKQFYSSTENLVFRSANSPDDLNIQKTGVDFGHTVKAMWLFRLIGVLCGEKFLVTFANEHGPTVLKRAYLPASGSWGGEVQPGAKINFSPSW